MVESSSYYFGQNSSPLLRPVTRAEGPHVIALNNYAMFEKNITPDDNRPHHLILDDLYVKVLAVHTEHQNRGHVRTLLSHADREAKELNYTFLTLDVDPLNGPGLSAYFYSGYKITDFKEGYYASNISPTRRFIMQKDLERILNQYQKFEKLHVEEYENIKNILENGFVGTALELSPSFDNRKNIIIFQR